MRESGSLFGPVVRIAVARWGEAEFFGGVAVAAVIAHEQTTRALAALRLGDWRSLAHARAEVVAGRIERVAPTERLAIAAERYNKACNGPGGPVQLMSWAYTRVCNALLDRFPECGTVVCEPASDGSTPELSLSRAVMVVAPGEGYEDVALEAGGALARWLYLSRLEGVAQKLGLDLGGDERRLGLEILRQHGRPVLQQVAKVHSARGRALLNGGDA